jgi:hypothetical protein
MLLALSDRFGPLPGNLSWPELSHTRFPHNFPPFAFALRLAFSVIYTALRSKP